MVITKSFNLDINTPWKAPTLYIKQGDADSRELQATIRRDGVNYTIPGDVAASFRMKKPDGTIVTQDCTISGSVVSVVMDAQCATAAGHAKAEIVLATAGEVVSTFLLAIEVMPAAVTDGDIESHDALNEYRTILEEMLRVKGAPLVANTAADMTDTDRVYVYTGSEVGYVNGSWYYYDGSAWVVGGVYNSQAISDAFYDDITQLVKQSAVATESDSTPYLYRPTPNPSAILADEEIVGGTIAWNQRLVNNDFTSGSNHPWSAQAGSLVLNASEKTATVTVTTANNAVALRNSSSGVGATPNHVYLSYADLYPSKAGAANVYLSGSYGGDTPLTANAWNTVYSINKPTASSGGFNIYCNRNTVMEVGDTCKYRNPHNYDLTAMFGSTIADYLYTLESTTPGAGVAKLREWGFLSKDYFAYDAGSLVSVNTEGKEVTGKNLINHINNRTNAGITFAYDEKTGGVTISGTATANSYSDGAISEAAASAYFYALPGTYHAHLFGAENLSPYPRLNIQVWYDDGTSETPVGSSIDASFTITKSAWIYTRIQVLNGSTFNNTVVYPQIEIGSIQTSFAPHRVTTYPTTPTDLNGIFYLDENNQLRTRGDVYHADGVIDRIYHADVIDGGANLTVASVPQHSSGYYYCAVGISSAYTAANNTNLFNNGGYSAASDVVPGHIYEAGGGSMIVVVLFDQTITTPAAANAYFASHPLHIVYELASAKQTTDIADPYPETQIVGKGGTEEWVDNRAVPVPVGHRTVYSIGVPDVPASGSDLVLKATVSGGKTTLKWE